jgi:hypothetical protein
MNDRNCEATCAIPLRPAKMSVIVYCPSRLVTALVGGETVSIDQVQGAKAWVSENGN